MAILVTGGAGFIGSHTAVELLNANKSVVIVDNLCNSNIQSVENIKKITKCDLKFYNTDCCCETDLTKIFQENEIEEVIHFAGFKAVGESTKKPLKYYSNNLKSTLSLCEVMKKFGCNRLVFSSSATVYGAPKTVPIKEDFPTSTTNPYGTTKLMIETILRDMCTASPEFSVACLRYFNPIGAHKTGIIGEMPNGIPNNLMPYITQVAAKKLKILSVFGNDYPTHDGTGVRDYIHVVDLAKGHLSALKYIETHSGFETFNLGTGTGYSVLDILKTFEKVNNITIPYKITDRRPGDIAICYADPAKSKKLLNWQAQLSLEDMCYDSWNFTKKALKIN